MEKIMYQLPTRERYMEVISDKGIYYFQRFITFKECEKIIFEQYQENIDLIATLQNYHDHNTISKFEVELVNDINIHNMTLWDLLSNKTFYEYIENLELKTNYYKYEIKQIKFMQEEIKNNNEYYAKLKCGNSKTINIDIELLEYIKQYFINKNK